MSDELFPLTAVSLKSPRLQWMERHGIVTWHSPCVDDGEGPWNAAQGTIDQVSKEGFRMLMDGRCATGETEDEALTRLCRNLGIKLWNEE
jgi:hypothetical protein